MNRLLPMLIMIVCGLDAASADDSLQIREKQKSLIELCCQEDYSDCYSDYSGVSCKIMYKMAYDEFCQDTVKSFGREVAFSLLQQEDQVDENDLNDCLHPKCDRKLIALNIERMKARAEVAKKSEISQVSDGDFDRLYAEVIERRKECYFDHKERFINSLLFSEHKSSSEDESELSKRASELQRMIKKDSLPKDQLEEFVDAYIAGMNEGCQSFMNNKN